MSSWSYHAPGHSHLIIQDISGLIAKVKQPFFRRDLLLLCLIVSLCGYAGTWRGQRSQISLNLNVGTWEWNLSHLEKLHMVLIADPSSPTLKVTVLKGPTLSKVKSHIFWNSRQTLSNDSLWKPKPFTSSIQCESSHSKQGGMRAMALKDGTTARPKSSKARYKMIYLHV